MNGIKEMLDDHGRPICKGDIVKCWGGEHCQGHWEHEETIVVSDDESLSAIGEYEHRLIRGSANYTDRIFAAALAYIRETHAHIPDLLTLRRDIKEAAEQHLQDEMSDSEIQCIINGLDLNAMARELDAELRDGTGAERDQLRWMEQERRRVM